MNGMRLSAPSRFDLVSDWASVPSLVVLPVVAAGMIAPALLARAFVLSKLSSWYAPSLGLSPISMLAAFGLCLFVAVLLPDPGTDDESRAARTSLGTRFALRLIGPSVILLVGWIGTLFA